MEKVSISPFTKFTKDWALVTAGTKEKFNSMTIAWVAWGHYGEFQFYRFSLDQIDILLNFWKKTNILLFLFMIKNIKRHKELWALNLEKILIK